MRSFGREQHRMIALVCQVHHFGKLGFLQKPFTHLLSVVNKFPPIPVEPVKRASIVHRHVHFFRFVITLWQKQTDIVKALLSPIYTQWWNRSCNNATAFFSGTNYFEYFWLYRVFYKYLYTKYKALFWNENLIHIWRITNKCSINYFE